MRTTSLELDAVADFEVGAAPSASFIEKAPEANAVPVAVNLKAPQPGAAKAALEFPSDFKACLDLLHKVNNFPQADNRQLAEKLAVLKPLRAHIARIQQGLPILAITADGLAGGAKAGYDSIKQYQIEALARQFPVLKEALDL